MNTSTTPLKVLADGTEVPATDPRTDHVAVLFPDTGWMVARKALTDSDGEALDNADAVDAAAKSLQLLGHQDWITAPLDEVWLRHVLKHDRYDPAVDTNLFPDLPLDDWYWTGTAAPWSSGSAFFVDLLNGYVLYNHRNFSGFGLACRRARQ
ncbi:MAG: Lcl C-terminal domain-containing protein [Rhodanobacter sp.]